MNPTTLKEVAQKKKMISELRRIEEHAAGEHFVNILVEKSDRPELNQANKALKKLNAIKKIADSNKMDILSDAIQEASDEVNEFTAGGTLDNLFKKSKRNPVVKALAFLNTLENGFTDTITLINNSIPDYDPKKGSPFDQLEDNKRRETLGKAVRKAFRPEGFFASMKSFFGNSGGVPYISDIQMFSGEVLDAKGEALEAIIQAMKSGPSASEVAKAVQGPQQGGAGSGGTVGGSAGAPTQVSSPDQLIQAIIQHLSAKAESSPQAQKSAEQAQENPKKAFDSFIKFVAGKSKKDEEVVKKVVNALMKNNLMRASINEARIGKSKNVYTLTMKDVVRAQVSLLESSGSKNKFINIWSKKILEDKRKDYRRLLREAEGAVGELKAAAEEIKDADVNTKDLQEIIDQIYSEIKYWKGVVDKSEEQEKTNVFQDAFKQTISLLKDLRKGDQEKINSDAVARLVSSYAEARGNFQSKLGEKISDESIKTSDKNIENLSRMLDDALKGKESAETEAKSAKELANQMKQEAEGLKGELDRLSKEKKLSEEQSKDLLGRILSVISAQLNQYESYDKDGATYWKREFEGIKTSKRPDLRYAMELSDKIASQMSDDVKNTRFNRDRDREKFEEQMRNVTAARDNLVDLMDKLIGEKSELEGKLANKTAEAEKLVTDLEGSKKGLETFKASLAKSLKINPEEFDSKVEEAGGIEALVAKALEKKPEAVERAAAAAGVPMPSGESGSEGGKKHAKAIEKIKDSLEGVSVADIEAILDEIPSYLMIEARRRMLANRSNKMYNLH